MGVAEDLVRGIRLGIDPGNARIGVARSDPDGMLATPVETVIVDDAAVARIADIAQECDAAVIYVGLPRSLSGGEGPAAQGTRSFAHGVGVALGWRIPIYLCDERMTTLTAEAQLREQGRKGKRRRQVVDQAAAVVILQTALDRERATHMRAGERLLPPEATKEHRE